MESIRIGGNLNIENNIVDYFWGIVAGMIIHSDSLSQSFIITSVGRYCDPSCLLVALVSG